PLVNSRSGADLLGPGMSDRDVTWRAFLQQQFRRLNARLGVKPFAHSPVKENVGDGNHAHPLMMRHEGPHDRKPGSLGQTAAGVIERSEEHTSELQSRGHLVCGLLLEKKKTRSTPDRYRYSNCLQITRRIR